MPGGFQCDQYQLDSVHESSDISMHRGMQPSREKHRAVNRSSDGQLSVQDIDCARVYHVNSVMEVRTQVCCPDRISILTANFDTMFLLSHLLQ